MTLIGRRSDRGKRRSLHSTISTVVLVVGTVLGLGVFACGGAPFGPTDVPTSALPEDLQRQFSGEVVLPPPVLMDLTLVIRGLSLEASSKRPQFVATLFAQDSSTVDGSWELRTSPPRSGRIRGTLTGGRSGYFDGVITETRGGCEARREFSGRIAVSGLNWTAGAFRARCPGTQLEFTAVALTSTSVGDRLDGPTAEFFEFTVSVTGEGTGVVTSSPEGIDCSAGLETDCGQYYRDETEVTLTATAASGSVFTGWSGDCDGGASTTTVTLGAARSCTARFDPAPAASSTLTVSVSGDGTGTVTSNPSGIDCPDDCSASYATDTQVALTATAANGSIFAGWSGDCDGGASTTTVTLGAARSCTARFDADVTLSLEIAGSGTGSVTLDDGSNTTSCSSTCSQDYSVGTTVTLVADPANASTFTGWTGDCTASGDTATVTMSAARSCTATFDEADVTLSLTIAGSGSGTVTLADGQNTTSCSSTCSQDYSAGTTVTLVADPANASTFTGWTGDCTASGDTATVTMSQARSCTAVFDLTQFALTVDITGSGSGTVRSTTDSGIDCPSDCRESYADGTTVILEAVPEDSASFLFGWTGDCSNAGRSSKATIEMTTSRSCTAEFRPTGE